MAEWQRLLEVVRALPIVFTAGDLSREARLTPSAKKVEGQKYQASGNQKASAYLAKFCKLGYVRRVGVTVDEGKTRESTLYEITPFGKSCKIGTGAAARLIAAVEAYAEARGQRGEEKAFREMMQARKAAIEAEIQV